MLLLPIKSKNPPESLPLATLMLIVVNCAVFGLTSEGFFAIRPLVLLKYGLTYENLSPLTMLSSMFLHGDFLHLIGNMWFLYLFGFAVEGRLRSLKFLGVFFAAGILGDLAHTLIIGRLYPDVPSLGASGAIMGVLGAALYMFPFGQVNFFYWAFVVRGVFTAAMWVVGLIYLGMDLVFAYMLGADSSTAHLAHLGGAAGGFFMAMAFRPMRDSREASDARAVFSEMKDLSLLTSGELASMAASNPDDARLVLNWMERSMREGRVTMDCHNSFMRLLPQILAREDVRLIGFVLAAMSTTPGYVQPAVLIETATRLERLYDHATALRLYDAALRDPGASHGDREAALFRSAQVCESAMGNPQRAVNAYRELVRMYPMSPLAAQAKARLGALTGQAVF